MAEPLSGRDLEIATARALRWTARFNDRLGEYQLFDAAGGLRGKWYDERALWNNTAGIRFLDDPAAFAEVLAALDDVAWTLMHRPGLKKTIVVIHATGRFSDPQHEGETLEEAVCRAFVAWKSS